MNKNILLLLVVALGLGILVGENYQGNMLRIGAPDNEESVNSKNCLADDCLAVSDLTYPVTGISEDAKKSLVLAIEDEYKAYSFYNAVIKKFGSTRPFSMIIGAEEQHIASLRSIFDKYGLKVPENNWINKVSAPATLKDACQAGVDAEISNASLYKEKLLLNVSQYEDITTVFTNLMNASQNKHLPAFERCN